jgi:hypothetical protein
MIQPWPTDEVPDAAAHADAVKVHGQVQRYKHEHDRSLFLLGRWLGLMHDHHLYEQIGYPTWIAYLAAPDVGISKTNAQRYMDVARTYLETVKANGELAVPGERVARIGLMKADIIAPLVQEQPERADEWVARAETLTVPDLRLAVRAERGEAVTAVQEAQDALARKLMAICHHLTRASDPLAVCDELAAALTSGRAYLALLVPSPGEASPTGPARDKRL